MNGKTLKFHLLALVVFDGSRLQLSAKGDLLGEQMTPLAGLGCAAILAGVIWAGKQS